MLTFSEFKNILQLIASDDSECRILGQELAKQYKFNQRRNNQFNDCIYLDGQDSKDNMVNQINPVYSQSNNYVTSRILDEKFEDSTHPLQYWWSLTKVPNSDIDTWLQK